MAEEFEGDLTGSVFWGADLTGAMFRDVNLTDVTISHAWLVNVDIDALVDRVVVNGVDVTEFVNERDPWYPLRAMLRPDSPGDMRETWAALESEWATTIDHARSLTDDQVHQSANEEFSFVQTLRHLVMAMDKWFTAPILGEPFDPIALPNTGSLEFPFPGIDLSVQPSFEETLAVRAARSKRFGAFLDVVTADEFSRVVDILENGPNPLVECLYTVFEEEFWHLRYARRDLAILTG